jgi:hypothetical protein
MIGRILPELVALVTGVKRYKPDFEWASNSWTVNAFRVYESIFGRRIGIRHESSLVRSETGEVVVTCFSWEAKIAFVEWRIREFLKSWKWAPIRITVPILTTPDGFPFFASPYVFAIAADNSVVKTVGASPNTQAFTVTGSNPFLVGGSWVGVASTFATAYTYNSVSATRQKDLQGSSGSYGMTLWTLLNPSTGSNTISVTSAGNSPALAADSFSGVLGGFDALGFNTNSNSTSISTSTTVVASNCWLASVGALDNNPTGGSTNNTQRQSLGNWFIGDSNATVGTGAQSAAINCNAGAGTFNAMITISISPTAAAGSTGNRLTMMGVGS